MVPGVHVASLASQNGNKRKSWFAILAIFLILALTPPIFHFYFTFQNKHDLLLPFNHLALLCRCPNQISWL